MFETVQTCGLHQMFAHYSQLQPCLYQLTVFFAAAIGFGWISVESIPPLLGWTHLHWSSHTGSWSFAGGDEIYQLRHSGMLSMHTYEYCQH